MKWNKAKAPDPLEMWSPGCSIPSTEGNEAIAMMMRLEGIVPDSSARHSPGKSGLQ